jgi:hypothetical protein
VGAFNYYADTLYQRVAQHAVLFPTGHCPHVRVGFLRNRKLWRRRAIALRKSGYFPKRNIKQHNRRIQCWPCGVRWSSRVTADKAADATPFKVEYCGWYHICPFCHGRIAEQKTLAIDPIAREIVKDRGEAFIYLLDKTTILRHKPQGAKFKAAMEKAVHPYLKQARKFRKPEGLRAYMHRYSFRLVRSDGETAFTIRSRLFVLADQPLPVVAKQAVLSTPVNHQADLFRPLARFFKYDTYMLTDSVGEVQWVLEHAPAKWFSSGGALIGDNSPPTTVISINDH